MRCNSCGSENLSDFTAEIAIHFPRVKNVFRPHVFVFPALMVCLACGAAQFALSKEELSELTGSRAASA